MTALADPRTEQPRPTRPSSAGPARSPLGQRLVVANLLAPDELEAALSRQEQSGERLGETLLELGFVTEDELLPFIESQLCCRGNSRSGWAQSHCFAFGTS
jgi:hypothetical protein